jgi:DNA polymerase III delta prime subunit
LESNIVSYEQELSRYRIQEKDLKEYLNKIEIKHRNELNNMVIEFNKEKENMNKEKQELLKVIEDRNRVITEKEQELINMRAENDSTIVTRNFQKDNSVVPLSVQKDFEELLNLISDLQVNIFNCSRAQDPNIESKKKICYRLLIENCFEPNIWKTVNKEMKSLKLSTLQVSRVI